MSISKKWSAAAAGLLTIALVGAGATAANAAPGDPIKNPQSNGSKGSFYLFDENAELAEAPGQVFDRAQFLMAATDHVDYLSEIDPDDFAAPGTWDTVYKFIAKPSELNGGTGSWRAYALDSAAGPNGGVLTPNLTLGDLANGNNGGIDSVFAADGEWLVGLAFTTNAGVTPVGTVYRTVVIDGDTDTYTYAPIEYDVVQGPTAPTESDLTAGLQDAALATETVDSKSIAIAGGAARAGQTLTVGSFPAGLTGQVTLDASGNGTIDAAAIPFNQATKVWLSNSDYTGLVWDSFTLTQTVSTSFQSNLTAEVTASNRFELIAPANLDVDLGDVRRNQTTTPVALGQFSVIDDRNELLGWNVNTSVAAFTGAGNIPATALGYAPVAAGGVQDGVTLGAAKTAGEGAFGVLVSAAAGSSTTEAGAQFNADLTFKAPVSAVRGTYNSTLTLDLVSK